MEKFILILLYRAIKMRLFLFLFFISLIGIVFTSCLTAGTHGSLETYKFAVSKSILQKVVSKVIKKESNITIAPITDTFTSKYYNDGERYITIQIELERGFNVYTFQYTGTQEYWDTSKNSEISIAYAFDKDNNGGSEGDGNLSSYKSVTKERLLNVFKNEFINKIDTLLHRQNLDHTK